MSRTRLITCVLLPFAAGYYLSYLFRSINALIAGDLTAELGLTAADLGLLTSVYFLIFAAVQLPFGVLLDCCGPRLIQSALLVVASIGSLVFALADGVFTLMLGRTLIGLGVAVALMAGLKAIVLWFPPERVALANGWFVMLGALGALTATGPAEFAIQMVGWRGLFAGLAALSAVAALLILMVTPEADNRRGAAPSPALSLWKIYQDRHFWRIAPLSAAGIGTSWSLQGLWAAPWLRDVAGLDRASVVEHLTVMAVALAGSALLLGSLGYRLGRAGVRTELILASTLTLSMSAQLALLLGLPIPSHVPFAVISAAGAATVLSFAALAQYFPREAFGRANAALGVLHVGAAFGLQSLAGLIIAQWPAADGHYPAEAHQAAMALGLALQVASLAWFLSPKRRRPAAHMAHAVARAFGSSPSPAAVLPAPYAKALSAWNRHIYQTRRQARAWRFATPASVMLCAGRAASLSLSMSRPAVALHMAAGGDAARVFEDGRLHRTSATLTASPLARLLMHCAEPRLIGPVSSNRKRPHAPFVGSRRSWTASAVGEHGAGGVAIPPHQLNRFTAGPWRQFGPFHSLRKL